VAGPLVPAQMEAGTKGSRPKARFLLVQQGRRPLGTREGKMGTGGGRRRSRSRPSRERVWRGFVGLGGLVGKNDLCLGRGWSGVYIVGRHATVKKLIGFFPFLAKSTIDHFDRVLLR
jgi:hypothetical protein